MNYSVAQLRRRLRQGLAATLFTLLLFGACAAALSAVAAGITALAGMRSAQVVVAENTQTGGGNKGTAPTNAKGSAGQADHTALNINQSASTGLGSPGVMTTGSYVDELNHRLDHMESPIGHTLDSGGVALGEQVQKTFGRVLSGVLETLFFERNVGNAQTGGQP